MEHKNLLLAIALSIGFLFVWSMFVVPRFAPPPPPAKPSETPLPSAAPVPEAMPASPETKVRTSPEGQQAKPVTDVTLQDDTDAITLAPRGGAIKQWRLQTNHQSVDLVLAGQADPLPLATFPDMLFSITTQGPQAIMKATLPDGLRLTKTLTLGTTGHLHTISLRFENPTARTVKLSKWEWGWGPGLGTVASEQKENPGMIRVLSMTKLKTHILKEADHPEFGRWVGIDNRYYMVAFVPNSAHTSEVLASGKKESSRLRILETTEVAAHGQTTLEYELYVGPKGYTQLMKYGKGLEAGVDFGMFSSLGKLILRALYRLRNWTGNYGWAIILLTMIIQVLMLPLTFKSFKSMLAMKKIQPKIAELQARYKGDPKRLNVEMMNLYKHSGTNPFGGCLPMLLQLPIFWALFTTLRNAYELRGAPFIGWIKDLSVHDPYYVLPIVMGAGMFVQQRMSGAVTDPTQRQMMYIMPIMFTVMFLNFPSGLVLYWLVNSLLTMAFQWVYQRHMYASTPGVVNTSIIK